MNAHASSSATAPTAANSQDELDRVDVEWAWSKFEPAADRPWSLTLAAHLFRRASFGATWAELQQACHVGLSGTLDQLMAGGPETSTYYEQAVATLQPLLAGNNSDHLPAWWLYVMVHSPHPLLEKLTLFWHGHFATSAAKVTKVRLMYQQNADLRANALGSFRPMLDRLAKDPAMLLWLDSATNRRTHPNENFAREVMELFSLGLGNYTEHDIKEAARAFTGWEIRQDAFRFSAPQHDVGSKTVLGKTGNWDGDDILRILLDQPAAAQFIVRKLFRYLVSEAEHVPASLLEPLAAGYRRRDYDNAWLVRTMLESNLFFSDLAVHHRIKSPVDLAIGVIRSLEGTTSSYALADSLKTLGQLVFFPPNVKGWDGGTDWINSSTLIARANLVWALVGNTDGRFKNKIRLTNLHALDGVDGGAATVDRLVDLLLSTQLPDDVRIQLVALASEASGSDVQLGRARLVHAIATLPEFQLS